MRTCSNIEGGGLGALHNGKRLHRLRLKVAIADLDAKGLEVLAKELGAAHGESNVLAIVTDVSKLDDVVRLRDRVSEAWGEVSCGRRVYYAVTHCLAWQVAVLLNNAGIAEIGRSYEGLDMWKAVMDVNLFGYVSIPRFFAGGTR